MKDHDDYPLYMENVGKRFPGTIAVDGVTFDVKAGEVHALVGENGAGKSTLMKMLSGAFDDYTGTISIHGREVRLSSPAIAKHNGIGMIYQELSLAPPLSIAENVLAGRLPVKAGLLDRKETVRQTKALLARVGLEHLDPLTAVSQLSQHEMQLIEVAKVLGRNPKIIVMDEPTSALTREEVERLFSIITSLKQGGLAIVYISHHLSEIFKVADRVTVMRDGRKIGTYAMDEVTAEKLAELMVGHTVDELYADINTKYGAEALRVEGAWRYGFFHDISFSVRSGEVVGICGLSGAGRSEIARSICGLDPLDRGTIHVKGRETRVRNMGSAVRLGHCLPFGEPQGRGSRRPSFDLQQHRFGDPARAEQVLLLQRGKGEAQDEEADRLSADHASQPRAAGFQSLGRQPAEGAAGKMARLRPVGSLSRRADPGRRRRGKEGHPRLDHPALEAGACDRPHLLRSSRAGRAFPPHPRDPGRSLHRGDEEGGMHGGERPAGGKRRMEVSRMIGSPDAARYNVVSTRLKLLDIMSRFGVYVMIVALLVVGIIVAPDIFPTLNNLVDILEVGALLGTVALGMTFVTYSGNFLDMSIPSTMAFSGIIAVQLLPYGIVVSIVGGLLTGRLIGGVNGYMVGKLKANPIIWTLAVQFLVSGMLKWAYTGNQIYPDAIAKNNLHAVEAFYGLYRTRSSTSSPSSSSSGWHSPCSASSFSPRRATGSSFA